MVWMSCSTVSQRTFSLIIVFILLSITLPLIQLPTISENSSGHEFIITQESSTRDYWPTDGWRYSTPAEQGMDNDTLTEMMDLIEEQEYPIDSVLVIKNGYAVFEEYPHEYYPAGHLKLLHSVTKSFTSTLIGIAIEQGSNMVRIGTAIFGNRNW